MQNLYKLSLVLFTGAFLLGCGGTMEDRHGNPLQDGKEYLMTEDGLEPIPYMKDRSGNQVQAGRQYVMTADGLEPVPYLKDKTGKRVMIGNEYVMTGAGLALVRTREIKGVVTDGAGKPLKDIEVAIVDSDWKSVTGPDGAFSLPFVEGSAVLRLSSSSVPEWCSMPDTRTESLDYTTHPDGLDIGVIELPCVHAGEPAAWATMDGSVIDNGNGTVTDTRNGLMWAVMTAEEDHGWHDALTHCENLRLGGYSDWRLPSHDELEYLFSSQIACRWRNHQMIPEAMTLWSSDQVGYSSVLIVNLCTGKVTASPSLDERLSGVNPGTLAVRFLK